MEGNTTEATIAFSDADLFRTLAGEKDANLRVIEEELDVKLGRDNSGLVISGQDSEVELAHDLLLQLREMLEQGEQLFPGDIDYAIRMLSGDRKLKLAGVLREHISIGGRKHTVTPKTVNQKTYIEAIRQHDIVFGVGPAGTGKTYLAMAMALSALLRKDVSRVVLCRPAVEAGEKLGFLPGDMAEKVNPYLRPLYDALHDMVDHDRAREMVERGTIEVAPLAFMRGRTLGHAFVILDEAQNTSIGQMKMLLTRLGQKSKCVITGDVTQVDLPHGVESGLVHAVSILEAIKDIATVYFNEQDVIRHRLVASIVAAYQAEHEAD